MIEFEMSVRDDPEDAARVLACNLIVLREVLAHDPEFPDYIPRVCFDRILTNQGDISLTPETCTGVVLEVRDGDDPVVILGDVEHRLVDDNADPPVDKLLSYILTEVVPVREMNGILGTKSPPPRV
jgi:hypothetical protein